jgi:hypothetical protein
MKFASFDTAKDVRVGRMQKKNLVVSKKSLFETTLHFSGFDKTDRSSTYGEKIWGLGKRQWSNENALGS